VPGVNKLFYPKIALSNLKKNANIYVPYLITAVCSVMTFYIMSSISQNKGILKMPGGDSLKMIMELGTGIIAIFAVVFLFYTNSFLIKRRKKELGLYSILGMEKRHIAKILFFETVYSWLTSMFIGLPGGILLSRLMFLLLLNVIHFDVTVQFSLSAVSLTQALLLFFLIFLLTMLANFWMLARTKGIDLLKGGQVGEREPKTKWIITTLGLLSLGTGYYIAVTVKSPLQALTIFFVAVLLVIIGTYLLFTAGSIVLLKLLRKNKGFYYKSRNFIAISGMIYRMKQNAVGLANICILSTMVLVIMSTTVCLYIGKDDLLDNRYPMDVMVEFDGMDQDQERIRKDVEALGEKYHLSLQEYTDYVTLGCMGIAKGSQIKILSDDALGQESISNEDLIVLNMVALEDYNRLTDSKLTLQQNEILVNVTGDLIKEGSLTLEDQEFSIKDNISYPKFALTGIDSMLDNYFIVVSSKEIMKSLNDRVGDVEHIYGENLTYVSNFDIDGSDKEALAFVKELKQELLAAYSNFGGLQSRQLSENDFYAIYGGFLFLGIFLGALFTMAMVLIIYYKQISEGFDDNQRFKIMQQVGLSRREVKGTIHRQIIMVFFLPLLGAIIHICFAFGVISELLLLFAMTNTQLFILCTIGTVIIFGGIYALIYLWTAKVYYKLVQA
jgi:putative ABC transport system permease protein